MYECSSADVWTTDCPTRPFNDPAYDAQAWVYELINVVPAWSEGYTGAGVQIVFNDDGLDTEHAEFAAKFNAAGSCNDPTPVNVTTETHGTICAGLAVAWNVVFAPCVLGAAPEELGLWSRLELDYENGVALTARRRPPRTLTPRTIPARSPVHASL